MSFLNHAGTSWPKPDCVQAAVAASLRADPADWGRDFEREHGRVCEAFGIAATERLLLTPGCTAALSLAISDHSWRAGDRLLSSSLEHHALSRPASLLHERGVAVERVPRASDGPFDLDVLERELARGGVRLVAVTAACNVTGELLPVAEIIARAHAHGALCLVDGAQVCGWLPIDLVGMGVDLFAFAGHKGLLAPWGIGGLYAAPEVAMTSPAASCALPAPGEEASCATMPGYCDGGSVDRAALAGLVAALDWLAQPEQAGGLERARGQVERLACALEECPGVRLHGVRDPAARLPTIAFTHEERPTRDLVDALARRGVVVGSGLQCAPLAHEALGTAPGGVVRLSTGRTTHEDELERALEVIAEW